MRAAPTWMGSIGLLFGLVACRAPVPSPGPAFAAGHEIVVAGQRFPIDAPVVLWDQPPGYDAHSESPRFRADGERGKRYEPGRRTDDPELARETESRGWTVADLARQIDLFVIHYDVCGTSQACFRVLQDVRSLSVHFLLDVDGTIYQTLDLAHTAWHARAANRRSIGVEIAQIGAYPRVDDPALTRRYQWTESGARLMLDAKARAGLRFPDWAGGPARPGPVEGTVHGQRLVQYDFTPEQYRSLAALAAALARVFPRIALDAPRDAEGDVRNDALDADETARFHGCIGHAHLQADKIDPGPAFDWERFLVEARALRAQVP
jgi:N-acetylmuramoyl-L-alanine amidase